MSANVAKMLPKKLSAFLREYYSKILNWTVSWKAIGILHCSWTMKPIHRFQLKYMVSCTT